MEKRAYRVKVMVNDQVGNVVMGMSPTARVFGTSRPALLDAAQRDDGSRPNI